MVSLSSTAMRLRTEADKTFRGHWDGELDKAKEYVRDTLDELRRAHVVTT